MTGKVPLVKALCLGDVEIRRFRANDGKRYYIATDVYQAMGYKGGYNKGCFARVGEHLTQKYCIPMPGRKARNMCVVSEEGLYWLLKDKEDRPCVRLFKRLFRSGTKNQPDPEDSADTCQAPEIASIPDEKQEVVAREVTEKEMYELTIEGLKGALRDKDRRIDILERRVLEYENKALFYSGIKILEKQLKLEG